MVTRWIMAVLLLLAAGVWAQGLAPVNPEFLRGVTRAPGAHLGYAPSPVDWSHLRGGRIGRLVLPTSYDLRTQGKLTAIRDQSTAGTCWAFGTLASLESCQLPGTTCDFSENHLKNNHGFAYDPNTGGGNRDMTTAYVARWSGPVNESDDPYNPNTKVSPTGLNPRKHVQDVIFLPARSSSTDNTAIKTALMNYGAVATVMFWDDTCYNSSTQAFYNPNTTSSNHLVAIVGWDDNYSKANFRTVPPANGAFIVRNSWGGSWGNGGYFYISYYDLTTGKNNTVFANAEATTNYTRIYQYDPLGATGYYGYGSNMAYGANTFTASASENITAVSTYAATASTGYVIDIYTNSSSGPISGTKALTQSGTFTDAGYHTVALTSPVAVTAGQKFSVVVKLTTSGYNYPVPLERPLGGYSPGATAAAGQSYISYNGTSWSDATTLVTSTNVCIKAFAGAGSTPTPTSPLTAVSLAVSPASPKPSGTTVTLTATPTGSSSVEYKFETCVGGVWSTLRDYGSSATQEWTPSSAGSYSLRVSARDTDYPDTVRTASVSYTVSAPLTAVSLTTSVASPRTIGTTIRLTATKTGGASVQFQFSASSNGGTTWTVLQAYGTSNFKDWIPNTAGSYQLKVAAREGSTGTPVESSVLDYTVVSSAPTVVALAAAPTGPQPVGANITLTATKTGGGSTVQYLFEAYGNGTWATVRAYDTAATATWTPAAAGSYTLRVTAREPALPTTTVVKTATYTVVPVLTAVSLTPSLTSPQPVSKTIRLSAAKTGGANVQYQFSASNNGGTTWTVIQGYSTAVYKDWMPTSAGSYQLKASAREGATGTPVTSSVVAYTVTPAPPTAVTLTFSPVSPQVVNTAITLTAVKTGGTSVEYKFETSKDGLTYTTLRDWATGTTQSWTPDSAGTWRLRVTARESSLPAVTVTKMLTYTINGPLTAVSFSTVPVAPQPINTSIKITAVAAGGANVQYQFSVSSNGGSTWSLLQSYSSLNYKAWVPAKSGEYQLKVSAREGSTGTPVEANATTYYIAPAPPTAVTLTCAPVSPQVVNTAVTLTGASTGGTTVEYKFEASSDNGVTYNTLRDWGTGTSVSWTPASALAWKLRLSGRESTLPAKVVSKIATFSVAAPLSAVSLTTSLASPQMINASIKLTVTKTGGANVQYQFSASSNGGTSWTVLQPYGTVAAIVWVPSTSASYRLKVAAREGSSGTPVESSVLTYTINGPLSAAPNWHPEVTARLGEATAELQYGTAPSEDGTLAVYETALPDLSANLRAGDVQGQWAFAVRRPSGLAPNEDLILCWPSLRRAPSGTVLTLVDLASGERRYLRTTPAYRISAARGAGEFGFLLLATRQDRAPLHILDLRNQPTRGHGALIEFSLTSPAEAYITIRAVSGRTVRRLTVPPNADGCYAVPWDGRAEGGSLLPAGVYQAEVLATDDEGRSLRAMTVVVLP